MKLNTMYALRPGARVLHSSRLAIVLDVDSDATTAVWIHYVDNPDEDAMALREDLAEPCALCEKEPATVDAIEDDRPVRVCAACYGYETGA